MRKWLSGLVAIVLMAAYAQAQEDVLPVERAFRLTTALTKPGHIALHWEIADGYYLYRSRIKAKTEQPGITLKEMVLPAGEKKHDEFLGNVEIYHQAVDASQDYTLENVVLDTFILEVTVQGCHESKPKICYPPYSTSIALRLPEAQAAESAPPLLNLGKQGGFKTTTGGVPLPPEQAFVFEAIASGPAEVLARWTMPKGYYLYRDKTQITLAKGDGVKLGAPQWPHGVAHNDENFGSVEVYFDQVELPIPVQRTRKESQVISLNSEFQGCQEDGICYPVMTRKVEVSLPAAQAATAAVNTETQKTASPIASLSAQPDQSEEQKLALRLSSDRLLTLLSFFGFGLLLAFTPCVFPMIPILSGIIAGVSEPVSTRRAFMLSLIYVLASSLVFTGAGVLAGLAGANVQAMAQKPWILWSFSGLFVLLALSMFGFYELQLPSRWQSKLAEVSGRQQGGSLLGVAIMGILSALIVGPCVAPPLAAGVLYISQTHDPVFGGLALFILSLGMGAPLVVFGTAAGRWLPRSGAWMNAVKNIFGVCFLALAIAMLSRILEPVWIMLMVGTLLVGCSVYLGALDRVVDRVSGWRKLWHALGVLLLVLGIAEIIGAMSGAQDLLQPLKGFTVTGERHSAVASLPFKRVADVNALERELSIAAKENKPVMLDFYADWCVSCKEMEKFTFSQSAVQSALTDFILLKADVTANDVASQALLKRFELIGPPATIFFAQDGSEQRASRLIGFEKAEAFLDRLKRLGH